MPSDEVALTKCQVKWHSQNAKWWSGTDNMPSDEVALTKMPSNEVALTKSQVMKWHLQNAKYWIYTVKKQKKKEKKICILFITFV